MLNKFIHKLNQYRMSKSSWIDLAWHEDTSAKEYIDKNEGNRREILIALQFDKKPSDEAFIQFLINEEIKDRANDPFQGGSDSLHRAGFLLAEYKNPSNVELFIRAKTANFDTHCGFDWEHILSAGVAKTFDQIKGCSEEIKDLFHSYFETRESCELSEKDIENWLNNKKKNWYPNKFDELEIEDQIDLAFKLNEITLAKELVDKFEKTTKVDDDYLYSLKYYRGQLNDYKAQIALAEQLLDFQKDMESLAWRFIEITGLHLKLGQIEQGWLSIKRAIDIHKKLSKGRLAQVADSCILIINSNDKIYDFSIECYTFGISHLGYLVSLDQAQEKLNAAIKMQDTPSIEYFKTLVIQEQSKQDAILAMVKRKKNA